MQRRAGRVWALSQRPQRPVMLHHAAVLRHDPCPSGSAKHRHFVRHHHRPGRPAVAAAMAHQAQANTCTRLRNIESCASTSNLVLSVLNPAICMPTCTFSCHCMMSQGTSPSLMQQLQWMPFPSLQLLLVTRPTGNTHACVLTPYINQEDIDVAIVGGGIAGLITAAAVRRACPGVSVKVGGAGWRNRGNSDLVAGIQRAWPESHSQGNRCTLEPRVCTLQQPSGAWTRMSVESSFMHPGKGLPARRP
jgi:hypothetical protein